MGIGVATAHDSRPFSNDTGTDTHKLILKCGVMKIG
jgi:hypothetical protein